MGRLSVAQEVVSGWTFSHQDEKEQGWTFSTPPPAKKWEFKLPDVQEEAVFTKTEQPPPSEQLQIISRGIPMGTMGKERALKTGGGMTQFAAGLVPGGRQLMGLASPVPEPETAEERVMGGVGKFTGLLGAPSFVGGKVAGLATKGVAKALGGKLAPTIAGEAIQLGVSRGVSLGTAGVLNDLGEIKSGKEALDTFKTYAIMGEIFGLAGMAHLPKHPVLSQIIRQVGGRVLLGDKITPESFSQENIGQTTFNELLNTFFLSHGESPAKVFRGGIAHAKALRFIEGMEEKPTPAEVRAAGGPAKWLGKSLTELAEAAKPVQELAKAEGPDVLYSRERPSSKDELLENYQADLKKRGVFTSEVKARSDEAGTEYIFPGGKKIILSRSLDAGESGKYPLRLTWFDEKGPSMHIDVKNIDEAATEIYHEAIGIDGKMPQIRTAGKTFTLANEPEKPAPFKPGTTSGQQGVLPMPDAAPLFAGTEKPKPPDTLFSTVPGREEKALPPQERLPDTGTYPAVRTDDGGIYVDKSPSNNTHVGFILKKGIPPERVVSGGWIVDGVYEASERSDTISFVNLAKARERLNANRRAAGQPDVLFSRAGEMVGLPTGMPPEAGAEKLDRGKERAARQREMGMPEPKKKAGTEFTKQAEKEFYERQAVDEAMAAIKEGATTYDALDPAYRPLFEKYLDAPTLYEVSGGKAGRAKFGDIPEPAPEPIKFGPERPVAGRTEPPQPPTTAKNVPSPAEAEIPLGRAPQTLPELQSEIVRINEGRVSTDQAAALGALVKGVARYKGMTPDEYVAGRFAGLEAGTTAPPAQDYMTPADRAAIIKDAQARGITEPAMIQKILNGEPIAAVEFLADGKAVLRAFRKSNIAGMAHELGHVFRRDLSPAERTLVEGAMGVRNGKWDRYAEEKWARQFELYLRRGKTPNPELDTVFAKFKKWLGAIYQDVKTAFGPKARIHPNVTRVLDKVLGGKEIEPIKPVGRVTKPVGQRIPPPGEPRPEWEPGASEVPPHGPTITGAGPSPINPIVKTLGPEGMSMTRADLDTLMAQKKLPSRKLKYSYLNPIYIFEDFPFFKKHLYDKKVDADANFSNAVKGLHTDIKAWQKMSTDKAGVRLWAYAIGQQKGGPEALARMGITDIPELSPNEMQVYGQVRQNLEKMYVRINEARGLLGLEPIGKIENYFTFLRKAEELEAMGMDPILDPDARAVTDQLNRPAEPAFFKHRGKGGGKLETNFFKVYEHYMRRANKYVENAPVVANAKLLLESVEYKDADGKAARYNFSKDSPVLAHELRQWTNFSTGHQAPSAIRYTLPSGARKIAEAINRNIATAILSANLRSALIQPTSLRNSYVELGRRWLWEGAKKSLLPGRSVYEKLSRVLPGRQFDIHAAAVAEGPKGRVGRAQDIKWKVAEWGITPLKVLDYQAAKITGEGAYAKATAPVSAGGLGLSGRDAIIYADDIITKTQASAAPRDISPVQRTLEGKIATMFQTFVINEWNFLSKHALGWQNEKMTDKERFSRIIRMVVATAVVNVIYEDVLKMRSPFPTPEHAILEGIKSKSGVGTTGAEAGWEMLEQLPILGGTLRWSTDRKTMYPAAVQAYGDVARLAGKTKRAISEGDLGVFQPEDLSAPLRLAGIPGVGQVEKAMRRREQGGTWPQAIMGQKMENRGSKPAGLSKADEALLKKYGLSGGKSKAAKKKSQKSVDDLMKKYGIK